MTTRAELRASIGLRLKDAQINPLWDAAEINDYIGESIRRYGARFPRERSVTVTAAAPATSLPVVPAIEPVMIARVIDPSGAVVPRQERERALGGERYRPCGQEWRWWNQTLLLSQPAMLGEWTIEYFGARFPPATDGEPLDMIDGDDDILIWMTIATAVRRRAVEDGKRGAAADAIRLEQIAETYDNLARSLISRRRRHVKLGWLA